VWITFSHYPMMQSEKHTEFTANKQVVLVRNPLDILVSQLNFVLTLD
jgi:hypothetical protein